MTSKRRSLINLLSLSYLTLIICMIYLYSACTHGLLEDHARFPFPFFFF